ncbi:MAG: helix-turn-helix domain-containing protein [Planctomycetota bacterium]
MKPPTPRMLDLARIVLDRTTRDGRPPSRRQLADLLNVSLGRVQDLIRDGRKRGLVKDRPGEGRTIEVVDRSLLRRRATA